MGLGNSSNQAMRGEIARLTAQLNQVKGQAREEGPVKLLGSAGDGRLYKDLTPEERRAMSSSEIDELLARERAG